MIEIQVTTKLNTREFPWERVMQGISEFMLDRIKQNFLDGGRVSPWAPLAGGGASHLIKTGQLFNSLRNEWNETTAKVTTSGGLPYAAVHQYGGIIRHPGSDKPQAFTVDGVSVFTHHTDPHSITIPERPYMVLGEQDVDEIVKYIEGQVVNHYEEA